MTQKQQILNHLRKGPITTWKAMNLYGVMRLSERIRELSADGHNIEIDYPRIKTRHGRTRVAWYWLVEEAV